MNYYLIMGHPTKDSFNGRLADAYEEKLKLLGNQVRRVNIIDLNLNLVLNKSGQTKENEEIIKNEQENIKWAMNWSFSIHFDEDLYQLY